MERGQSFTQEEALENQVSVITPTPSASPNISQDFYQVFTRREDSVEVDAMENMKKELVKAQNKLLRKKLTTTVGSVNPLSLDRTLKATEEMRTL